MTELTPCETENPMGGYGKTISHVVIGLKTGKGTKQLKVRVGAMIYVLFSVLSLFALVLLLLIKNVDLYYRYKLLMIIMTSTQLMGTVLFIKNLST